MNPEALHKAAILVSALDTQAADALLEQMGAATAERVRAAVMDLPEISEAEQAQVIEEFLGRGKRPGKVADEVELELSSTAAVIAATAPPPDAPPPSTPTASFKRFAFLAQADDASLARILQKETPQIAAVILAHLPPERAADVLRRLPTSVSGEVLYRIAHLDEMHDEVLLDLEQQLQAVLSPELRTHANPEVGIARLDAILQSMPTAARTTVVAAVARRDHDLADRLQRPSRTIAQTSPPQAAVAASEPKLMPARGYPAATAPAPPKLSLRFDDLAELDDAAWEQVLRATSSETVLLAFAGAEPRMIDRIVRGMPRREAEDWRRRFAHPGPVRVREIDAAQQMVARTAVELADQGLIRHPTRRGFAAAA